MNGREKDLLRLLREIRFEGDAHRRIERIRAFQTQIWSAPREALDTDVGRILEDLAADLDYYEPEPELRREAQLCDEERMLADIDEAIARLRKIAE